MKKLAAFSLIGILFLSMNACKKGENDPLISLRSRNARLTGTWNLTSASATQTSSNSTTTTTFDGTNLTITEDGSTDTEPYSLTFTFDKDGTYTSKTVQDGEVFEATGSWWWLDTDKNKSRIALDDDFSSWHIDQLKNKEMIWTQFESEVEDGESYTLDGELTFEKQ